MQVTFVRDHLPPTLGRLADIAAELLVAALAAFMAVWGYRLCGDTWDQSIAEFPALSVGVTYLPIPLGGLCLMLFVVERLAIGRPSRSRRAGMSSFHSTRRKGGAWKPW